MSPYRTPAELPVIVYPADLESRPALRREGRAVAVAVLVGGLLAGLLANSGCAAFGEKREAAVANIAADKVKCISDNLGKPTSEVIDRCAKNVTGRDLENIMDLIFGLKQNAAALGANIPDAAPPGAVRK